MPLRLLVAIAAAVTVVLSGPFVGRINTALQEALPGQHLAIIAAIVVLPVLVGILTAVVRIRDRRRLRYGALTAAVSMALLYVVLMETIPTEQFHLTEYGVVTFLFYRAVASRGDVTALLLPVCATLMAGMADEWIQWLIPSRVGELRDVLLNGVGIVSGLLFGVGLHPPSSVRMPSEVSSRRVMAATAAALVLTAGGFLQSVHLGFEIADPAIGTFRSRYSAQALAALAADRAGRWTGPLPPAALISIEDHYLSEATYHVQERNDRLGERDPRAAWKENLILETYYRPVLDLAMPASRWAPEQRADVEAQVGGAAIPYVSDAYPLPIYLWHRAWFWSVIAALVGGLVALARVRPSVRHLTASV